MYCARILSDLNLKQQRCVLLQNHPQRYEKEICASSNPARENEFFVGVSSVRMKINDGYVTRKYCL